MKKNRTRTVHKFTFSLNKIITYFIIISFLFPRGYLEYSTIYKSIYTSCVWISTLIICLQSILVYNKTFKRKEILLIMSYFIFAIVITILVRGANINGFQKLFAYPSIFLFIMFKMKKTPKNLLNTINNVMLIIFVLNQLLTWSFFLEKYHITFLGHVQLVSQLGVLSIFCAMLYWLLYHEKKKKTILIVLLSLFTMLTTDASSAVISAIILIAFAILYKFKLYRFLVFNSNIYIIGGIILSMIIICLAVINNLKYNTDILILNFSGRSIIWTDALFKIRNSILLGYGVEGVLLDVFWNKWTNSPGFNYAHNQLIQNLLDGGIVILITYFVMIFSCFKGINIIKKSKDSYKYKVLINSILIAFSFIMIFESTSLYCYMYIYLAIVYMLPNVINNNRKVVK